jgi:hypothetical protein
MVDSTKGLGPLTNISGLKPQSSVLGTKTEETKASERVQDSVEISQEAISLSQAEEAADKIKVILGKNPDITLGLNPAFVDESA